MFDFNSNISNCDHERYLKLTGFEQGEKIKLFIIMNSGNVEEHYFSFRLLKPRTSPSIPG
jgi:hypothetical protein